MVMTSAISLPPPAVAIHALNPPLSTLCSPPHRYYASCSISTVIGGTRGCCCGTIAIQKRQQHLQIQAFSPPPAPKGFGAPPKKKERPFTRTLESAESEDSKEEEEVDDVVPEIVTNRMLKRIGFTVGLPVFVGVLSFPVFYYARVVGNVDVPVWIPFATSLFTFGSAGFGITYGVLSTSWDPLREGSLLGWEEAQTNWPNLWKGAQKKKTN
ncbi:hypothetical protein O6H91_13G018100 [Diphasiastrum complanatum]|uniref:Uncharacterized protein n=1 Tax=Diphasiastrum complanatum TaxID=34168 RepID=A0ACC2BTA5_DIPCM|nr:hypothetical protein O6H91_13G018100 [Diphasiastrum complanatum]